ncbi:MAG: NepR family anti-sigma factor [Parasphingorhabdus sp.]|uniref:NepR family anti-sigma factor n=1 Tax=Parasphingorhabdus sp. TaxID=2709688 RepID=UPI003003A295
MSDPTNKDEQPGQAKQDEEQDMIHVEAQERLGAGLKTMYHNVLQEPLPEDMLALLDKLDDSDSSSGSGSPSNE